MRAAAAALVIALAACSGGPDLPSSSATTTTSTPAPTRVGIKLTAAEVMSARTPAPEFPLDVQKGVTTTLDRYLQAATAAPLRTGGKAPAELDALFSPATRPRLAGEDRRALVDEGFPKATLRTAGAEAALTALVTPDGKVGVVVARMTERVSATNGFTLTRTGDFTLVPEGDRWLVDGYEVSVTRQVPGQAATTTTAKASS